MKTIKGMHKAVYEPIADLITYRAMPTDTFPMNILDPFIFLNHHGKQEYLPHNQGLPFGPHPHRGFETVTFIIEGDLTHKDSSGSESVIEEGGVQWMTAGSGLIHAEISSDEFKKKGGPLEILQLWINLPSKLKMTKPNYVGLQQDQIPMISADSDKVTIHVVSGKWNGTEGAFKPLTDVHLSRIDFREGGKYNITIPPDKNVFLYIVHGEVIVNGDHAHEHHIVEFNHDGQMIEFKATTNAMILLGYATPFKEPFMAYGPFVMNTREEIMKAYEEYHAGSFGRVEV